MTQLSTLTYTPTMIRVPKRERTRRQLITAGLHCLAERGDAMTASDVVAAADVSNGTFYNHFANREDFLDALAHESLIALTDASAEQTEGDDPAWRFAAATSKVLTSVADDPLWGRVILRLSESPSAPHREIQKHLSRDLAEGCTSGRFDFGDDPITLDLVTGSLMASIRRLAHGGAGADAVAPIVTRLLVVLGLDAEEAATLANRAATEPSAPS